MWMFRSEAKVPRLSVEPSPKKSSKTKVVYDALLVENGFVGAQELHRRLLAGGEQIGLATVYRNLQSLVELGSVTSVLNADKELIYRVCEEDTHHHHLRCRICGATVTIESDSAEVWAAKVAKKYDYVDVSHTFDVVGVCPRCQAM